jgi:TolA-binding protein
MVYSRRVLFGLARAAALLMLAFSAAYASLSGLNSRLNALEGRVGEALENPSAASSLSSELDTAEGEFEEAANGRVSRGELMDTYVRLESMLNRIYQNYQHKKDACIAQIDAGGNCDYDQPEQLALRALYPLSWLHYRGALLYSDDPAMARRLLNQAIDGFTSSTLVIFSPELIRENLLGRALCERELGKYDHQEYNHAIADFKRIMHDGPETRQYRAAQQGLAATYAAMGQAGQAAKLSGEAAAGATGQTRQGLELMRLRELFEAEKATTDPGKRASIHREAVDYIKARQDDKNEWAIALSAVAQYVPDPVAEFGDSSDPFEKWLLASVLYFKRQPLPAAKYFTEAAETGHYPKAYKYAADLYYTLGRIDLVEKLVDQVAAQPGNPDAQWASYMRFKLPRLQWERTGKSNAALEKQWMAAAEDYLKAYPRGQYAFEPRFRIAERLQKQGKYAEAIKQYQQVAGNPSYDFTAVFNAAECNYLMVAAAEKKEEAAGKNATPMQRRFFHDARGRAIYMLASLQEHEGGAAVNHREIAAVLAGYESDYPGMSDHFNEIFEWRLKSQAALGQWDAIARDVAALVKRNQGNLARSDFIKEIGADFWRGALAAQARGDQKAYLAQAQLTALDYGYFEDMVKAGKIPAKNLTGTLSILGQAYAALGQSDKAEATFAEVVKADAASPDANAGLARIAQSRKDYKSALDLWSRVEATAAQSDNLWYQAKYNMAEILATEGNVAGACNKLAATRSEHPSLGSPQMKAQWLDLQNKICLKQSASE